MTNDIIGLTIFADIDLEQFTKRCYECGTILMRFSEEIHHNDTNWYCRKCKAGMI